MMIEPIDVEFVNLEPRCACMLLLDTSSSMSGKPIAALNEGLKAFQKDLQGDDLAKLRVEVAIVTFGNNGVQPVQDFVIAGEFTAPYLTANGNTPMGAAIVLGLDLVEQRKSTYKKNGVPYYRPWVFMITDGAPTDEWRASADKVRAAEAANSLSFFAVGVAGADMALLGKIAVRQPLMLDGLKFVELFLWLSKSQRSVSGSKVGEQTALTPTGWAKV